MAIDLWGLALQAINVLILVWLLSRFLWRPVANAIAQRQKTVRTVLDDATATQTRASIVRAEVENARSGLAAERQTLLSDAMASIEATKAAKVTQARQEAENLVQAAQITSDREIRTFRKENAAKSAEFAVEIAQKLLERVDRGLAQNTFQTFLIDDVHNMSGKDRAALTSSEDGVTLFSASDLADKDKSLITTTLKDAVGDIGPLTFKTDPSLIAGFEIRATHFSLHNSWRADLDRILSDVKNVS